MATAATWRLASRDGSAQRAQVRTGASINTVDTPDFDGSNRRQAYSIGGSYAVKASVFVDGQFTGGSDPVGQQWGVAARFVY